MRKYTINESKDIMSMIWVSKVSFDFSPKQARNPFQAVSDRRFTISLTYSSTLFSKHDHK